MTQETQATQAEVGFAPAGRRITSITETIAEGVAAVMDGVGKIVRSEVNQHGGYKYASVDAVYAALRKLMAGQRLSLRIDIKQFEVRTSTGNRGQEVKWMHLTASIGLTCEMGPEIPVKRHLMAPITGPQSFEAAISYLSKQYLRQRFMLETGEAEMDEQAPSDIPGESKPIEVEEAVI